MCRAAFCDKCCSQSLLALCSSEELIVADVSGCRYQVEGSNVNQSTNASAVVCPNGYTKVRLAAGSRCSLLHQYLLLRHLLL